MAVARCSVPLERGRDSPKRRGEGLCCAHAPKSDRRRANAAQRFSGELTGGCGAGRRRRDVLALPAR